MRVMVVVMVVIAIIFGATGVVQGLGKQFIDRGHSGDCPGELADQHGLPVLTHHFPPLLKLLDMSLVVFNPVLQHHPQFFDIIHGCSTTSAGYQATGW